MVYPVYTDMCSTCMSSKLLQYVIVRRDLLPNKKASGSFSMGAVIAQACHAATAAIFTKLEDPHTRMYLSDLENMTVCVLGVDNDAELRGVANTLDENHVPHHLWIEKPEMFATAIATSPIEKESVAHLLGHLKLLR